MRCGSLRPLHEALPADHHSVLLRAPFRDSFNGRSCPIAARLRRNGRSRASDPRPSECRSAGHHRITTRRTIWCGRRNQDRQRPELGMLLHRFDQLSSAHHRHQQIDDDQARAAPVEQLQCLDAVGGEEREQPAISTSSRRLSRIPSSSSTTSTQSSGLVESAITATETARQTGCLLRQRSPRGSCHRGRAPMHSEM